MFQTQQKFSVKNDWIIQLNSDLDECNISLTENEIKEMKKEKFKTLVNKKIKRLSNEYLMNLQQSHRKSRNVFITENIKSYLISDEISVEQKRLLFLMRNVMCDVKTNYKSQYSPNMLCRLCESHEDSESNMMLCEEILNENIRKETSEICHSDIWSTLSKQISAIKVFETLFKIRNLKIEKKKLSHRDPG